MKIRLASKIQMNSIVDGPGLRMVLWTQGCPHHCPQCHNPQTHHPMDGFEIDCKEIIQRIQNKGIHRGITFSGGEPFEQAKACVEIAKVAKKIGLNIWIYTGYTFEFLLRSKRKDWLEFLSYGDVLVDGPFEVKQKNLRLPFRGSENQRIIDIHSSLREGKVVLWKEYMEKSS